MNINHNASISFKFPENVKDVFDLFFLITRIKMKGILVKFNGSTKQYLATHNKLYKINLGYRNDEF